MIEGTIDPGIMGGAGYLEQDLGFGGIELLYSAFCEALYEISLFLLAGVAFLFPEGTASVSNRLYRGGLYREVFQSVCIVRVIKRGASYSLDYVAVIKPGAWSLWSASHWPILKLSESGCIGRARVHWTRGRVYLKFEILADYGSNMSTLRLTARRIASFMRYGEKFLRNVRCVREIAPQIGVRWASGGAANPAREAKAASPSKVVKKGGAAAKDEGLEKRDKFAGLVQVCLDSPPLVRHLKEMDRLRELEREKLGLVGKKKEGALQRDKANVITKQKKQSDNSGTDAADAVEVFTATEQPSVYELTKEEGMRLAKEYSRFLMKEARLKAVAENVRLQLKKDAIAALPPRLREKALVPDLTPFPPTRIPASLTPSIPGYVEEMTRSAEASAKIQRMR